MTEINLPKGLSKDERVEAKEILSKPIRFVDCKEIRAKTAHLNLFRKEINRDDAELVWYGILARDAFDPNDAKPKVAKEMLLTREEEKILFLQYNYAKLVIWRLQQKANTGLLTLEEVRKLLLWSHIAFKVKSKITVCNLGLVKMLMAKRGVTRHPDADEYFEEANEAILRAIELFEVSRGFKFSTYCCRAIFQRINRALEVSFKRRIHFVSDSVLSSNSESPEKPYEQGNNKFNEQLEISEQAKEVRYILLENLAGLSEIEAAIVRYRFNMLIEEDYTKIAQVFGPDFWDKQKNEIKTGGLSLENIGTIFNLTKERIRQIQSKALKKIREIVELREIKGSEVMLVA